MRTDRAALRRNGEYALLSGAYWMLYCVAVSFSGVFLLSRGFSNARVGLVIALGHIAGLLLQPPAAAYADRSPAAPLRALFAGGALALLSAAGLLLLPGNGAAVSLCYILLLTVLMVLQPLVNAFSFWLERLGAPIRFGFCRAMGSLCFAGISLLLGLLAARLGGQAVPGAGVLVSALLLGSLLLVRREGLPPASAADDRGAEEGLQLLAPERRGFLFLLAGTVFLFFSHGTIMNFLIQIVENVGGDSGDMGTLGSFIALLELPAMLLFDRLRRRFSCAGMLRFAGVFFLVKTAGVLLASSLPGLYAAYFFQALSFPLFIPASVLYAGERMPARVRNRAQALVTVMITAGNILASLADGFILDRFGVGPCLAVGSAAAAAGAALLLAGLRDRTSHTEKETAP